MSHRFVWVDIPVADLDRAIAFYAAVLGSAVTKEGGPGFSFGLFAHDNDDVAGCLVTTAGDSEAVVPIGPHGFRAIVLDSEGNRVALHSPTA